MKSEQPGTGKTITAAVTLSGALFLLLAACSQQPHYPAPIRVGPDLVFEISRLKLDVPEFFSYRSGGKNINFFVLNTDHKILSFLDACVTCYPRKMGYRYEEDYVVCRACNQRFPVWKLEKGIGGCYPIRIEGRMENGKYLIPVSAIETMAGKF